MHKSEVESAQEIVVCAGDSITNATFSSDYLYILRRGLTIQRFKFVNAGQNGDTSKGLLKRIDKDVLAVEPGYITILIGANDARQDIELSQALETYRRTIKAIISKIRDKTNVPVALISLSPLGENPYSQKNKTVELYNNILKDIADESDLAYLPLFEKLLPILIKKKPLDKTEFKINLFTAVIKSAFQKFILRRDWDTISARNGFSIVIDGIHLNDKSGKILADLIQEWLLSNNKQVFN
jgi:acyl-CoA thioesterase-1